MHLFSKWHLIIAVEGEYQNIPECLQFCCWGFTSISKDYIKETVCIKENMLCSYAIVYISWEYADRL